MSATSSNPPIDAPPTLACPECGWGVAPGMLETHLRQVHNVHQFRGKRYAEHELIPVLLAFAVNPQPAADAWDQLVTITTEWLGWEAPDSLANRLTGALRNVEVGRLERTIGACALEAARLALAPRLIAGLAASGEVVARALALATGSRLLAPIDSSVLAALTPLLADPALSAESQASAVDALIRITGGADETATQLVKSYIDEMSKPRALARLELLQEHTGPIRAVAQLRSRIEQQVRMRCPRCPVELRRKDMIAHLWAEHGLVLDQRRAREPWRIIEDWVDEFKEREAPDLLRRCRELAQRVDPRHGTNRFYRLLLAGEVDDPNARHKLLAEAQRREVSLCPHCYDFVPLAGELTVPVVNTWRGRLSAVGYQVEVRDSGLFARLKITTPFRTLHSGPEPERTLTGTAWLLLVGGLPLCASLLLALALPVRGWVPLIPVVVLLALTYVQYLAWKRPWVSAQSRSLRHAWSELAPYLAEGREGADGLRFTAGLAELCERRAWFHVPRDVARQAEDKTLAFLDSGAGASALLAAWHRLTLATAAASGRDVVGLLATQVAHAFNGDLPLRYAHHMLAEGRWLRRSRADPARLRLLLCALAFEAGLEVRNILEAGQTAPTLERALRTADLKSLALLRLLWSLRSTRPWKNLGPTRTAFEIAQDPNEAAVLLEIPELLLLHEDPELSLVDPNSGSSRPLRIAVRTDGVMVGDVLLTSAPERIAVDQQMQGDRYDVAIDAHIFHVAGDASALDTRLQGWARFYFEELRPQSADVLRWYSGSKKTALHQQQLVECPGCHRKVFPRVGEVAGSLEVGRLIAEA